MIVNNELGRKWKEGDAAWFKVLCPNFPGVTVENHEGPSNLALPQYQSEAVASEPTSSVFRGASDVVN
jgi:hypothetical protein